MMSLVDEAAKKVFGETKKQAVEKGICISCKKPPRFYTPAGGREYKISGVCEFCFDEICAGRKWAEVEWTRLRIPKEQWPEPLYKENKE